MSTDKEVTSPLLTEAEVVKWLRLDVDGPACPAGTLKYYRQTGLLRAIRIGRRNLYYLPELERFCERLLQRASQEGAER